jgi:hypothetical protein
MQSVPGTIKCSEVSETLNTQSKWLAFRLTKFARFGRGKIPRIVTVRARRIDSAEFMEV